MPISISAASAPRKVVLNQPIDCLLVVIGFYSPCELALLRPLTAIRRIDFCRHIPTSLTAIVITTIVAATAIIPSAVHPDAARERPEKSRLEPTHRLSPCRHRFL